LGLILLLSITLFASACEPGGDITIENLRNEEVSIYVSHVREDGRTDEPTKQVVVSANATKIFAKTFIGENWINRIEAIDPSGKVVFSHDYKMADLEKISWKITIPPE
jgi:hypothetical protein